MFKAHKIVSINVDVVVLFPPVAATAKLGRSVWSPSSSAIQRKPRLGCRDRASFCPFHFFRSFQSVRSHFRGAPHPLRFRFPVKLRPRRTTVHYDRTLRPSVRREDDAVGTPRRFVSASTATRYFIGVSSGQTVALRVMT